jgi:hypothetical protein
LLLLAPDIARADAGPFLPGEPNVWIDFIFTIDQDYPDYEFYLLTLDDSPPERLPITPTNPVRVSGPGKDYRYKWARVYAVRRSSFADFRGPLGRKEFDGSRAGVVLLGSDYPLDFRTALPFTDNRDRVEITYRVEVGPDGGRLVKIGENAGDPWVRRGWIAAAISVSIGIIGLGLWGVKRIWRRHLRQSLAGPHTPEAQ